MAGSVAPASARAIRVVGAHGSMPLRSTPDAVPEAGELVSDEGRPTTWIDTGSGGGYEHGESVGQRLLRSKIERHTPAKPGDPCPLCDVVDCEERLLAEIGQNRPSDQRD